VFTSEVRVYSPGAPSRDAADAQRLRWVGGKLHVARSRVPALVGGAVPARNPQLLDRTVELVVPPLGLLAAAATTGLVASSLAALGGVVPTWVAVVWLVGVMLVPGFVLVGFAAGGVPRAAYRALAAAPGFVAGRTLRLHRLVRLRADTWLPTPRGGDEPAPASAEDPTADPDRIAGHIT
jgi:hypothetical protein